MGTPRPSKGLAHSSAGQTSHWSAQGLLRPRLRGMRPQMPSGKTVKPNELLSSATRGWGQQLGGTAPRPREPGQGKGERAHRTAGCGEGIRSTGGTLEAQTRDRPRGRVAGGALTPCAVENRSLLSPGPQLLTVLGGELSDMKASGREKRGGSGASFGIQQSGLGARGDQDCPEAGRSWVTQRTWGRRTTRSDYEW